MIEIELNDLLEEATNLDDEYKNLKDKIKLGQALKVMGKRGIIVRKYKYHVVLDVGNYKESVQYFDILSSVKKEGLNARKNSSK